MLPSDFNLLVEEEDQFAPLTDEDRRKINSLQNRESVLRSPNLLRELELMKAADKKAEIQGIGFIRARSIKIKSTTTYSLN